MFLKLQAHCIWTQKRTSVMIKHDYVDKKNTNSVFLADKESILPLRSFPDMVSNILMIKASSF